MKRQFLILLFVSCLVAACSSKHNSLAKSNQGTIVCINSHYYGGNVERNDNASLPFSFELCNYQDTIIGIENVEPSCGCLHFTMTPREIRPKQKSTIKGYMELKGQRGHVSKSIFVTLDDGSVIQLRVICDLK